MTDRMLVIITTSRKLRKWPWQEQKYRVSFLLHGRMPFELTIGESEGYHRFFKRVYGKMPILRFDPHARPKKRKRSGVNDT